MGRSCQGAELEVAGCHHVAKTIDVVSAVEEVETVAIAMS